MLFNNLSDGVLRMVLTSMHERFEESNIEIELDSYDLYEGDVVDIINDILKYFSIDNAGAEEWGFFISLYLDNPDYSNTDVRLVKPELKKYNVIHSEDIVLYKTIKYVNEISSYIPLTENIIYSMRNTGEYDYWDGRIIDQDVYDSETNEDNIEDIELIK